MKTVKDFSKIMFYRGSVDFRKWLIGLTSFVENDLKSLFVGSDTLFVFVSKDRKSIKCVYWDSTGAALWTKKLTEERYRFGKFRDGLITLSHEEMEWLLSGIDISRVTRHKASLIKKIS